MIKTSKNTYYFESYSNYELLDMFKKNCAIVALTNGKDEEAFDLMKALEEEIQDRMDF